MGKTLEELLMEVVKKCNRSRCNTCEFFGRNNVKAGVKQCQALMFAKHLRENGVEVKDDGR